MGLTAALSGIPRGGLPLSQPSGHLGHRPRGSVSLAALGRVSATVAAAPAH